MKKRILPLFLAVCLCGGLLSAGVSATETKATKMQYGLTVDDNGMFRLNGKLFYGYGVNATPGALWHDPFDTTFEECIEVCKKYQIPFIRLPLTYGTVEEYAEFEKNPDSFFVAADRMLDIAQKAKIGVIVWVLNSQRYTSMLGEKASSQGDMNSKSMAFMKKYVKEFVTRYKDHPALWGWEVRNEGNLESDLPVNKGDTYGGLHQSVYGGPVGEVNGFDGKTSEEFMILNREFAKTVREIDPYRMISNGNAIMRESAYHLHLAAQKKNDEHEWTVDWTRDTLEQFRYMNEYFTPDPMDTISTHIGAPTATYQYVLSDVKLSFKEVLKEYVKLSRKNKKGFYFGEFGSMVSDAMTLDPDEVMETVPRYLNDMVSADVQLGTLWQHNGGNGVRLTDEGPLRLILAEIQKVNNKFKSLGLHQTDEYWAAVEKNKDNASASSKPSTSSKPNTTSKPNITSKPTASVIDTPSNSGTAGTVNVASYMVSRSTKLSISDNDSKITIAKPVTLDVFKRSIALKDGYTMSVLAADGSQVTADDATVDSACTAVVFAPDGTELRRFTITATDAGTTSAPSDEDSQSTVDSNGDPADTGWIIWLIVILAVLALGGGGFAFYYFYLRKRMAG